MEANQLSTKLKFLRTKNKLTLQQVADYLDVNKSSVLRWEKGETAKIKKPILASLSTLYNVPLDFLLNSKSGEEFSQNDLYPYETRGVLPILGKISAGLPLYAQENLEGYIEWEKEDDSNYFSLRVKGDSMNAARIEDGDILIIRKQSYVENGEIAAVMVDSDEATVKKFQRDGDIVFLIPVSRNSTHQIQIYNLRETQIKIIGKVVENKISFK